MIRRGVAALALAGLCLAPCRADRWDVALEKGIGEAVVATLEGASGTIDDPLLAGWAKRVGARVAAGTTGPLRPRFVVLDSAVANAWTAPGGTILVTRGLLETVDSDDELAAVLAHECAHVAKRHAWQQLTENAIALGVIGLLRRQPEIVRTGAVAVNVLRALGRSRSMELQADAVGASLAVDGGYDPRGMLRFLEDNDRRRRSDLQQWLSTHPDSGRRTEEIERALGSVADAPTRLSRAFAERGLPAASRRAARGEDPLGLPLLAPAPDPEGERGAVVQRAEAVLGRLRGGAPVTQAASGMQQLLLFNTPLSDLRAVWLASRAYAVQQRVGDALARATRCAQAAPGLWDRLEDAERVQREVGRGEAARAVDLAGETLSGVERAQRATALVLANLNLRIGGGRRESERWTRFAAQEGLLRYAETELNRVEARAAQAWRYVSRARLRAYAARLDRLVPAADPARVALWRGLLERRAGRGPGAGAPGAASARALAAVALADDGAAAETPGDVADALDRLGVAEPVAVALRLLVLDLEREMADL